MRVGEGVIARGRGECRDVCMDVVMDGWDEGFLCDFFAGDVSIFLFFAPMFIDCMRA